MVPRLTKPPCQRQPLVPAYGLNAISTTTTHLTWAATRSKRDFYGDLTVQPNSSVACAAKFCGKREGESENFSP